METREYCHFQICACGRVGVGVGVGVLSVCAHECLYLYCFNQQQKKIKKSSVRIVCM
jgi:hypothetical protein